MPGVKYSTKEASQESRVKASAISSTPRSQEAVSFKKQDNNGILCDISFTKKKPRS